MLERDLPSTDGQSVDIILAWDLLNYLTVEQLPILARAISTYCHGRTQLLTMIATHKEMPARPTIFRVLDSEHLVFEPDQQWQRAAPRYTEPDLKRAMADFDVDVSFLLRNGLQEYLLNYRPRADVPGSPRTRRRR